jgi:hypothetical protein
MANQAGLGFGKVNPVETKQTVKTQRFTASPYLQPSLLYTLPGKKTAAPEAGGSSIFT